MRRGKPVQVASSARGIDAATFSAQSRKVFILLFALILLSSITLKIYKADRVGIIYDESMTFMHYCDSVHTALNSYTHPNNHVLNSIFIYYAHKFFGFYEHFIRMPSLLAGIVFSLALAYIIRRTIESDAMRVASLALVSFVPFVFDYSYLARGYAFALAGIYTAIAFVFWLDKHKMSWRWWPIPVFGISLMNFLTFGSMLSSVLLLAAFNLAFVLFYSPANFRNVSGKIKPVIVNLVSVFLVSFTSVFVLYRNIYKEIPNVRTFVNKQESWKGWPSFVGYLHNLLIGKVFRRNDSLGEVIFYAVVLLLVISFGMYIYKFRKAVKAGLWRDYLKPHKPRAFIFIVTGLAIIFMFVYGVILNKSLGFIRSQVFLIPLVVMSVAIMLDGLVNNLAKGAPGRVMRIIVMVVLLSVTVRNLPSLYRMGGSTLSGPILRKLKAIDPDKTWNIAFSKKMKLFYMGFLYYNQFDYKFNIIRQGEYDVLICKKKERPAGAVSLNWEPFSDSNCDVVINCPLPSDRVVLDARLIED